VRLALALLMASVPTWACSCVNTATPCSHIGGDSVIFVAKVLVDSGEGWGKGPAHVAVEEALQNVPEGLREVDISTAAGTSCYFRLQAGERYVIITKGSNYSVAGCSNSFLLRGNEHILDALRNQARGGAPRLVGTVRKSTGAYSQGDVIAGASVTAESGGAHYETTTDGLGRFVLPGLEPGRYKLAITKTGYLPDIAFNQRPSGAFVVNTTTKKLEPAVEPGLVGVSKNACSIWDLAMWPAGSVSGTVQSLDQKPLGGVAVQAFGFDARNKRGNQPLRTATTGPDGRYAISPLPEGKYVIGVNGAMYSDENEFAPTFYSGGDPIFLAESGSRDGIDLLLPPPRVAAQLKMKILGPDGYPFPGAYVTLENMKGVQRWYSKKGSNVAGANEVPVYVGEQYVVKAVYYGLNRTGTEERLEGSAQLTVTDTAPRLTIQLRPKN
jgi:Carboxypeptidase regulatory-like domain